MTWNHLPESEENVDSWCCHDGKHAEADVFPNSPYALKQWAVAASVLHTEQRETMSSYCERLEEAVGSGVVEQAAAAAVAMDESEVQSVEAPVVLEHLRSLGHFQIVRYETVCWY